MPTKNCEVCGVEFQARLSVIRTCGVQCRNRLIAKEKEQRHKQTKACVICGSVFEVGSNDKNRQTCSDDCSYKLRASKTRGSAELKCVTCGAGFFTSPRQIKAGGGKYCSKKCLYERNKQATTRKCECCGKEFSAPPSQARVKACSTECGYKLSSGERKPNYKGLTYQVEIDGKKRTKLTRQAANEYNTRRRLVVARAMPSWADVDKMRAVYALCQKITKTTGIQHHVDHIVPLTSKLVCGLHNEFNLQVIPATDNLKKHNLYWPDKP